MEAAATVFLARALATAGLVIGVTLLVARAGPRVGGIVVGLPIVIGPGIFFLLQQEGAGFVAGSLPAALHALSGSVVFALLYGRLALRLGPWRCLGLAVAAWGTTVLLLGLLPPSFAAALAAFLAVLAAASWIGDPPGLGEGLPTAARRPLDLLLRGLAAGLAVGLVGLLAPLAGPRLSGTLLAYPVALTVLSITLHQRYGGASAARAMGTVRLSMVSIAAFLLALQLLLPRLAPQPAFWLAVSAALLPTALLMLQHRLRRRQAAAPRSP